MAYSTTDIGQSPTQLTTGTAMTGVTGVILDNGKGNRYKAGTEDGRVWRVTTPNASMAMAQEMLAGLTGKTYQPFSASRARVHPAAEIGDEITVGAVPGTLHGQMYSQNMNFASGYSDIGSPGYEEIDGEYEYLDAEQRAMAYTNNAIRNAFGEDGVALQVKIVNELPKDHANYNVLWVIPY